jgi:light-regulated signal transduction histidine kinase (bacteriophytochrome)
LIDDLLAFSRLSRIQLRTAPVDNWTLVHEVLHEMGYPWMDRTVSLQIGDLPHSVGDASLIKQVWMNLLSNAVKYTGKKPVAEIVVASRAIDGKAVFCVQDNGTGFDMKYAGKLFGVFERLHREEDFSGTGVGLAIAHRIVERHGGRIWAESKEGEGATFFFTIPS